ncbi:MarR family winged helix-turn-helix transcriptional regulator [Paenibacillus mesotrionivorans]|uniref:MarR family winged helix-turn-helix transcriptional regulator n=1 Tax=Paenibacillus mesotrionivorans TaxID=3160968 RepID=A0ACC7P4B6_9BACL
MEDTSKTSMEETDWLFRRMVRKFVKERDKILVEGVTLPGMMILRKLADQGEQRLGELAGEMDLTSGAITAICDRLEELDYAVRSRPKEDRRAVVLSLTEKGRDMFERNRNIGGRCISILFDCFTEEELRQQTEFYRTLYKKLEHFSETILLLAESNAAGQMKLLPAAEKKKTTGKLERNPQQSNYLSY